MKNAVSYVWGVTAICLILKIYPGVARAMVTLGID